EHPPCASRHRGYLPVDGAGKQRSIQLLNPGPHYGFQPRLRTLTIQRMLPIGCGGRPPARQLTCETLDFGEMMIASRRAVLQSEQQFFSSGTGELESAHAQADASIAVLDPFDVRNRI